MKTTVEIPDAVLRKAKSRAAKRGQTLDELLTEALTEELRKERQEPAWMRGFGKLRSLRAETARLQRRVDAAFERIEPEDR